MAGLGQGILAYIVDILRAFGAQYRCRKHTDYGMDFYAGRQIKIPIGREKRRRWFGLVWLLAVGSADVIFEVTLMCRLRLGD